MKTVLVGMNNPDRDKAFDPYKPNASGDRLVKMIHVYTQRHGFPKVTKEQFVDGFERTNLLHTAKWDFKEACAWREEFLEEYKGRRLIIFGFQVTFALGFPRTYTGTWGKQDQIIYKTLPHPSGLCRFYNDKRGQFMTGGILYREFKLGANSDA